MSVALTLFELGEEMEQISTALDIVTENGEDEAIVQAVEKYFSELQDNLAEKLDSYARLIKSYEQIAEVREAEAKRLRVLADVDKNNAKRLKERLKAFMQQIGEEKLEGKLHKFSVVTNPVGALECDPIEDVPAEYKEVQWVINTEKIREELKAGKELPFARFGERGSHLRIR